MAKAVRKDGGSKAKTEVTAAGTAPARPREATVHSLPTPTPAAPVKSATPSPQAFACQWSAGPSGSGRLSVSYAGPLAGHSEAYLRFGVRREGGAPWGEAREVRLRSEGARSSAALEIGPGATVAGIDFAVRAGEGWDNGGRAPLGYYEWRPGGELLVLE